MKDDIDMKIKAILSDAGNILFSDKGVKEEEWKMVNDIKEIPFDLFYRGFKPYHVRAQTKPDYSRENAMNDYLEFLGMKDLDISYTNKGKRKMSLYEGVEQTLRQIHSSGRKFIILTDATKKGSELRKSLEKMGIARLVDDIISSKDVGSVKPAREFFEYALSKHKLTRDEVLFLGHDLDELTGAYSQGIRVAAYNFSTSDDLSFIPTQYRLNNFSDLLTLLEQDKSLPDDATYFRTSNQTTGERSHLYTNPYLKHIKKLDKDK